MLIKNVFKRPVIISAEYETKNGGRFKRIRTATKLNPGEVKYFTEAAEKSIKLLEEGGYVAVLEGFER